MQYVGACASCAVQGISGLSLYRDKPFEAMKTFCEENLVKKKAGPYLYDVYPAEKYNRLYAHYIFCSGPEGPQDEYCLKYEREYAPVPYAIPFAAYIRRYKLGKVTTLPAILNHKCHPDTTCQVWIWQPNLKNLGRWYEKYVLKPEEEAQKKATLPAQPVPGGVNA